MRSAIAGSPSFSSSSLRLATARWMARAASMAALASASSPLLRGAPKTASRPSPVNLLTIPPRRVIAGTNRAMPRFSQVSSSPGLSRSETLVKEQVSAISTVTGSWRPSKRPSLSSPSRWFQSWRATAGEVVWPSSRSICWRCFWLEAPRRTQAAPAMAMKPVKGRLRPTQT